MARKANKTMAAAAVLGLLGATRLVSSKERGGFDDNSVNFITQPTHRYLLREGVGEPVVLRAAHPSQDPDLCRADLLMQFDDLVEHKFSGEAGRPVVGEYVIHEQADATWWATRYRNRPTLKERFAVALELVKVLWPYPAYYGSAV